MTLGSRVRYYRDKLGWTLEVLADRSQVDVGTINALENRNSQRSKYSQQLAGAFGLSIEQLVDESRDWLDATPRERGALKRAAAMPEGAGSDPWPFRGVTSEQYFKVLTTEDRLEIQGFVKGLLRARQAKAAAA